MTAKLKMKPGKERDRIIEELKDALLSSNELTNNGTFKKDMTFNLIRSTFKGYADQIKRAKETVELLECQRKDLFHIVRILCFKSKLEKHGRDWTERFYCYYKPFRGDTPPKCNPHRCPILTDAHPSK